MNLRVFSLAILCATVTATPCNSATGTQCVCNDLLVEREEQPTDNLEPMWLTESRLNCNTENIDAATMTRDHKTYFFKDEFYWRMANNEVDPGYPRLITQDWDGLQGPLDAALTWKDGRTFFFKGTEYWSFHGQKMDEEYPRKISDGFCGIPNNIDAAVLWAPNNKAYFFKGNEYWLFDGENTSSPVPSGYPKSISAWENIPPNVNGAVQWLNGRTYFLKGGFYYRYNDHGNDNGAGVPVAVHKNWGLKCEDLNLRIIRNQHDIQDENEVEIL